MGRLDNNEKPGEPPIRWLEKQPDFGFSIGGGDWRRGVELSASYEAYGAKQEHYGAPFFMIRTG